MSALRARLLTPGIILAGFVLLGRTAGPPAARLPVICPAVKQDDVPRTNALDENTQPPELVVIGTVVGRIGERRESFEVDVEKVLYGSCKLARIRVARGFLWVPRGKAIFALAPNHYPDEPPFILRYSLQAAEEKAMRALCAARLYHAALSAEVIFLGREVAAINSHKRTVDVLRVLSGSSSLRGRRITVALGGFIERGDARPLLLTTPQIHFIRAIDHPRHERAPIYHVATRQPADQENAIRTALGRRDAYPVIDVMVGGKRRQYREVLLRGTAADAIDILGSESQAAVILAARFLRRQQPQPRHAIVAAIDKRLLNLAPQSPGDHRRLKNLIDVLSALPGEPAKKELRRLLATLLDHIGKAPKRPIVPAKNRGYFEREENREDVNHALTWLLLSLDRSEVHRTHGPKLLRLRDKRKDGWRAEVQLALDVCRIEDQIELRAALDRMKTTKPVRSAGAIFRHAGRYVLDFSPDGKHLTTAGHGEINIWQTSDWTLARRIPLEGSIAAVRFSPEGRFLYVAGGAQIPILAREDWRNGKLDREYATHKRGLCGLELSADGKRLVTADYYDEVFHLTDTDSGKVLGTWPMKDLATAFAFSPDGRTLIRARAGKDSPASISGRKRTIWAVEAIAGRQPPIPELQGPDNWLFSPAGRYLISASLSEEARGTICVHDARAGYAVAASRSGADFGSLLAISGDGRTLVVVNRPGDAANGSRNSRTSDSATFRVLSVPSLRERGTFTLATPRGLDLTSLALSPDGKVLAVAASYHDAPYLFRTDTGERIFPSAGHSGRIRSVHFPAGGKTLLSVGADNHICSWDAATMRVRKRFIVPGRLEILSVREPDGRYLFCLDHRAFGEKCLVVVDTETGRACARLPVPDPGPIGHLSVVPLGEREAVALSGARMVRFDYRTGKVRKRLDQGGDFRGAIRVDPNGNKLCVLTGNARFGSIAVFEIDLATGKKRSVGTKDLERFTNNERGFVPGGKYIYVGDPDFYLLDRITLAVVARRSFGDDGLLGLTFPADGRRYAVVTGARIYIDRQLRQRDPQTLSVVRIHDTLSGKTLGAFPAATRWAEVRFAPDGKRLAVINTDGVIELWDLEKLDAR